MARYVYGFDGGGRSQAALLGGKGASLVEMANLGLPVPPWFTVTTEACRAYLATGALPAGLWDQVTEHLGRLERRMGRSLGDAGEPLLVSVRSGATVSMPGMMETVLNVGLTERSLPGLAARLGERFAWDSYRRLIQMFARTVLGMNAAVFARAGVGPVTGELSTGELRALVADLKRVVHEHTGRPFPDDPREQLERAVRAVFDSWNTPRARLYREREGIPDHLGTAVTVMTMVFGNLDAGSGTGVAFTRDPGTGAPGPYGDYLPFAQGEDVVGGGRLTLSLDRLAESDPAVHGELRGHLARLERHYRDLCDVEFTVERGRLWMLQTRVGKRTAAAAFRIACQLVDEGLIEPDEALRRVTGDQLQQLTAPRFVVAPGAARLARGLGASPGAGVGRVVFDAGRARCEAEAGVPVVLVRHETSPDDLPGMVVARAIVASRGGRVSHAAVVARGMGLPCVCGTAELAVDLDRRLLTAADGRVVREGDTLSVDGGSGDVYLGEVPRVDSDVLRYLRGDLDPADGDETVRAVHRLLSYADGLNPGTGRDAAGPAGDVVCAATARLRRGQAALVPPGPADVPSSPPGR